MRVPHASSLFYRAPLQPDRDPIKQIAIEITDDSLSEIDIRTGCVVIVEISTQLFPDIPHAVITADGSILVRYVVPTKDGFTLVPANANYARIRSASIDILGYVHTVISPQ